MASSVNLAVTSATRSEPLLITTNWIIIRIMNMIIPITRLPPPTNLPNVSTTLPALPFFNISLVEDTLREILKIVVNNSIVGKDAISKTSLANNELKSTTRATIMLIASKISSSHDGIEIMKNKTAARRYIPINRSFFLIFIISLLSI